MSTQIRNAFAVLTVIVCQFASQASDASDASGPNVVLIMADDLGYHDLSCYGSDKMKTPRLDAMAREGVRLTSFYSGSTVCTPSRMALLTGAYPTRLGWKGGVVGYKIPGNQGLAPQARTMAEVFHRAGYATGICGKWHLGDTVELQPMQQGFDFAFYIKRSNNQTKKLFRGETLIADPFDNRRLTERLTLQAIDFIKVHRDRPFFLYLPFTAPHFPAQAHPDWKGISSNDAYGDVVEELDSRIGEILDSLSHHGIDRRTLVVFLSDNGPEPGQKKWASAKPFRGLKWSSLEGGTRVPCIVRWPGVIPANKQSGHLIAAIDLLPTIADACDIELSQDSEAVPQIDGVSVWETLKGTPDAQHARSSLLYWNGWADLEAIRVDNWKLYLSEVEGIADAGQSAILFDLASDPTESHNLADDHPERVQAMRELAKTLNAEIQANAIPLGKRN